MKNDWKRVKLRSILASHTSEITGKNDTKAINANSLDTGQRGEWKKPADEKTQP
jgi:hypothetical protein